MLRLPGLLCCAAAMAMSAQAMAQAYLGPGAYQGVDGTIYGPGGSTQRTLGYTTYVHGPNGDRTYNQAGNLIYGSDGSAYHRVGNTTYGPNNTSSTRIGDFTYIHQQDGSSTTCREVGAGTYCN